MTRKLFSIPFGILFGILAAVVLLGVATSRGAQPAPADAKNPERAVALPVGKWTVEFTNGVVETVEVRADGTASVVEPLRTSAGKAVAQAGQAAAPGTAVLTFEDDRTERWTPVGRRFVVEHWFPASRLPTATPVLGIAEAAK